MLIAEKLLSGSELKKKLIKFVIVYLTKFCIVINSKSTDMGALNPEILFLDLYA